MPTKNLLKKYILIVLKNIFDLPFPSTFFNRLSFTQLENGLATHGPQAFFQGANQGNISKFFVVVKPQAFFLVVNPQAFF